MPLRHFIYRCPACGHDPTMGVRDVAECPSCGRSFARQGGSARIRVTRPAEEDTPEHSEEVPSLRLARAMDELGGPFTAARGADGRLRYEARCLARRTAEETALRYEGAVLGFYERLGEEGSEGTLRVDEEGVTFVPDAAQPGVISATHWPYLEVRAVQTVSGALQLPRPEGGIMHFEFESDSPYRWEQLLRDVLRERYRRAGRGEILEFQPRIVTA